MEQLLTDEKAVAGVVVGHIGVPRQVEGTVRYITPLESVMHAALVNQGRRHVVAQVEMYWIPARLSQLLKSVLRSSS